MIHTKARTLLALLGLVLAGSLGTLKATTLQGTVVNKTTDHAAAGDEVRLYELGKTLSEKARTVTAADGTFQFDRSEDKSYMIGVFHQKIGYHSEVISPRSNSVTLTVYDSAKSVGNLKESADAMFLQTTKDNATVKVTEFFVLSNGSTPPRTALSESAFDFFLPKDAVLESAAAQQPGGLPERTRTRQLLGTGHFGVQYPLRPGTTKIVVSYQIPYSQSLVLSPRFTRPVDQMEVLMPAKMRLESLQGPRLVRQVQADGVAAYVLKDARPGGYLSFKVMGAGSLSTAVAKTTEPASRGNNAMAQISQAKPEVLASIDRLVPLNSKTSDAISKKQLVLAFVLVWAVLTGIFLVMTPVFKRFSGHRAGTSRPQTDC